MARSGTHIFLATPCYGGVVTHRYFHSVLALMMAAPSLKIAVTVETLARDSLIPRARNTLVAKFLAHPEATHLLFVDADIGFAPAHLETLLQFNENITACPYPLKQIVWDDPAVARARAGELITSAPLRYVGTPATGTAQARRGSFVRADYAGTGFMLIARAALDQFCRQYPDLKYGLAHATADTPDQHLYAFFDTMIDPETRHYLSEDYTFCARMRAIGVDIWLDTAASLTHVGTYDYVGDPALRPWADI